MPWESGFVWAYCKVLPHALSQHFFYCQVFAKFRPMQRNFHGKKVTRQDNIEQFFFFSTFISNMQPNLAKLFSGWLPLWLHDKILKETLLWVGWGCWHAGDIPKMCSVGQAVAYFGIAPTLGFKPVQIYILCIEVTTDACDLFHTI
jgi:hypothetical protein